MKWFPLVPGSAWKDTRFLFVSHGLGAVTSCSQRGLLWCSRVFVASSGRPVQSYWESPGLVKSPLGSIAVLSHRYLGFGRLHMGLLDFLHQTWSLLRTPSLPRESFKVKSPLHGGLWHLDGVNHLHRLSHRRSLSGVLRSQAMWGSSSVCSLLSISGQVSSAGCCHYIVMPSNRGSKFCLAGFPREWGLLLGFHALGPLASLPSCMAHSFS